MSYTHPTWSFLDQGWTCFPQHSFVSLWKWWGWWTRACIEWVHSRKLKKRESGVYCLYILTLCVTQQQELIPFAIVGSERNVVVDGKAVRGRKTRWGVINVEDEHHCEFVHLRNFLTRTHLQDLVETTAHIHYEAFRAKQLLAIKESTQPQTPSSAAAASSTAMSPQLPVTPVRTTSNPPSP